MTSYDTLGTEFLADDHSRKHKVWFLLFILVLYAIMLYFYIQPGAAQSEKDLLMFYIIFGLVLGVIPIGIDMVINNNKEAPLDTVTVEKNSIGFLNNQWWQAGIAAALGVLVFLRISITGQAFVKSPAFHVFGNVTGAVASASSSFVNAFLSGTCGLIENLVFFAFIFPTIYSILRNNFDFDQISASLVSILLASLIFTGYHWWRYGYVLTALVTVFIFGAVMCLLVRIFKTQWQSNSIHFVNNFAVSLFVLLAYSIQIVV